MTSVKPFRQENQWSTLILYKTERQETLMNHTKYTHSWSPFEFIHHNTYGLNGYMSRMHNRVYGK